ncbi:mitochondrial brown fat uncoupling protein, putative [Pediculus humanus corporis]|uniref:Mitochondrial brown fat uncoupling protein, putative n=1 Tax=Pediculus humanus subsp. corporis TaxID=121224 RepID=E0VST3_PEDHC|nr:mitochondrial brown fat uncoupling protein, putative [Pediculus humanus corporis]EEB16439.1 mitochondrial brown fat uncoupling protein, putative [Pediculus humanus corporis]
MPSAVPPSLLSSNSDSQEFFNKRLDYSKLIATYIMSVLAASIAEIVTYPLDLTKTRLQIQGERAGHFGKNVVRRGMLHTAIGIVHEEGLLKLWNGITPALYRHVIYSGVRIVSYETLRDKILDKDPDRKFSLWKSAVTGAASGAFAQFLANPTDLVKVQIQMEGKRKLLGLEPRVHSTYHAFKKILKENGIRGLWKGSIPNIQRAALVNLGDLTTYDTAKQFILKNTSLTDNHCTHVLSSACAGLVAATVGTPADVVKTRIMNQPTDKNGRGLLYKSSLDCLKKTIQDEGILAIYKGFLPIWIRMAPWSLTFWLSFEQIRHTMGVRAF